jgi:hypothetical protein
LCHRSFPHRQLTESGTMLVRIPIRLAGLAFGCSFPEANGYSSTADRRLLIYVR